MNTLILAVEDIRRIVLRVGLDAFMDEMIQRLQKAMLDYDPGQTVVPVRGGFAYKVPQPGLVEWMPILETGDAVTIKVVGYHPCNPTIHQLPTIISTLGVYDTRTGHLRGIADCTFLTAVRTGAASAIASQSMAKGDARVAGIIGCGAQAVTQVHALSRVFDLEQVLVYDLNPTASRSFLTRTEGLKLNDVKVTEASLQQLTESADIICTCTSVEVGGGPVFTDGDLKPWLHINAVGSDFPGKYEVPLSVLERSFVCPDFLPQAIKEGECQQLHPEEIGPQIFELIKKPKRYEFVRDVPSVFDSTGWALEDQVAMQMLLDHANDLQVGTRINIENLPADPRNPYNFNTEGLPGE
jgi:ornithine cyclodeaminase/alanine dehydrogenase-like protein (mu-crystallin family)